MRKFVYECEPGMMGEYCVQVHFRDGDAAVFELASRDDVEPFE